MHLHSRCVWAAAALACLSAVAAAQSASTWEYRLADGTSSYGRLEVRSSSTGTWGTVCDDSFGSSDALVACRSLGLTTSVVSYRTVYSAERGSSSQPILMDDLACTGSESSLDQCTRSSSHNCGHGEDVMLSCGVAPVPAITTAAPATVGPSATPWEYQLVNGSSTYGRLEVRPNATAAWGYVCNDNFGYNDAQVACRSLGLTTSTVGYRSVSSGEYASTSQSALMDELACSGSEARLDQCSRVATVTGCWYYEAIVLSCGSSSVPSIVQTTMMPTASASPTPWEYRLIDGTSSYGRLEVRPSASASWGYVCNDAFSSNDARVACRSLGLSTSTYTYRSGYSSREYASSTQQALMDELACSGTETRLDQCTRAASITGCSYYEAVLVGCGVSSIPTLSSSSTTAAPSTGTWYYRLAGGTSSYGRLEVRPSTSSTWGTVCDDYFSITDARVACRSMGFSSSYVSYRTVTSSEQPAYGTPTYFDDVGCTGSESMLDRCSRASSPNCATYEAIALRCDSSAGVPSFGSGTPATPSPPTTLYTARLVGGGSTWGRLEVRPSTSSTWGTVCDDSFGIYDARVACGSLGLSTSIVSYRTAAVSERGSSSQPIYLDDLGCAGGESNLGYCPRSSTVDCSHSEDVVISCGSSTVPAAGSSVGGPSASDGGSTTSVGGWYYRLTGGSNEREGRLEVRPEASQTWGTVCDDLFGIDDAQVACRALGHGTRSSGITYRTVRTAERGSSTQPTYFDNLECSGSESGLHDCQRSQYEDCSAAEAVWLECPSSTLINIQCGTECLAVSITFAICCGAAIAIVMAYMKMRTPQPDPADAHAGQQVMVQPAMAYQQPPQPQAGQQPQAGAAHTDDVVPVDADAHHQQQHQQQQPGQQVV